MADRSGTANRILEAKEKQREKEKEKADRATNRAKRYVQVIPLDLSFHPLRSSMLLI